MKPLLDARHRGIFFSFKEPKGSVYSVDAPCAKARFFQRSRSAISSSILASNSSKRWALRSRDLRAAKVLRARFMATTSEGSSTMMGGRGLSRRREPTPATDEWRPLGELTDDFLRWWPEPGEATSKSSDCVAGEASTELTVCSMVGWTVCCTGWINSGWGWVGCSAWVGGSGLASGKSENQVSGFSRSLCPKLGEMSKWSKSGEPSKIEGEVKAVRAVELGADMYGSWSRSSWGETVPMLETTELGTLLERSYVWLAGEAKAASVEAPPSKVAKSNRSSSEWGCKRMSEGDCW